MRGKTLFKAACIGYLSTILLYVLTASLSLVFLIDLLADINSYVNSFYNIMSIVVNGIDVIFFLVYAFVACIIAIQGLKDQKSTKGKSVSLLVLTLCYPLVVVLTCTYGSFFVTGFLSVITFLASAGFAVLFLIGTNLLSNVEEKKTK